MYAIFGMKMSRDSNIILITGSSGYIGSYFVKYFYQQGYKVLGLDEKLPPEALDNYLHANIQANIADHNHVKPYITDYSCKNVIHCAAYALVEESIHHPEKYFQNNVDNGKVFLDTCIEAGVERFVFSSTAAVYGEPQEIPIDEDHPKNPINPYGQSKKEFEDILLHKHHQGKILAGICRYFNACGADPDAEIGEDHDPETHLIPNLLASVIKQKEISIFGNDYPTNDGTCVRDFIHIRDLATSHHLLLEKMHEISTEPTFNLGTKGGYSLLEVLKVAEEVTGLKVHFEFKDRRPGDPSTLIANSNKAFEILGWKPIHSDLTTIVSSAYKWHQKQ